MKYAIRSLGKLGRKSLRPIFYFLFYFIFYVIHLIIPFGKFGSPYLDKATTSARAALPSPISAPPDSEMDYRIFNVRTWSFLCVRVHTRVGYTDSEPAQHFWLGKTLTICYCAPKGVWTSGLWISSPTSYQLSHPVTPVILSSTGKEVMDKQYVMSSTWLSHYNWP